MSDKHDGQVLGEKLLKTMEGHGDDVAGYALTLAVVAFCIHRARDDLNISKADHVRALSASFMMNVTKNISAAAKRMEQAQGNIIMIPGTNQTLDLNHLTAKGNG